MPEPKTINLVDVDGVSRAVPEADAKYHLDRGWRVETAEDRTGRLAGEVEADIYGGAAGTVVAGAAGIARGLTGGGSDVALSALGAGEKLRKLQKHNPLVSTASEIAGSLSPVGIGGVAARAGERVAGGLVRGGGTIAELAHAGVAAATPRGSH